jgi:Tol biopolymer transport system component/DNA-binding winged helix-turn-helix (wHTH) protein
MSSEPQRLYEFGPFRLDTVERRLLRDGETVPLTPKAFETLVLLVERGGRLVGKDELMKALWSDTIVEESNLTNNVWTLRKALGEDKDGQRYIQTVPKRGYRFTATVREAEPAAQELVIEKHALTRNLTEDQNHTSNRKNPAQFQKRGSLAEKNKQQGGARSKLGIAIGLSCLLAIGGLFLIFYLGAMKHSAANQDSAFQRTQFARLTNTGKATLAAISADGKYVAYGSNEAGRQSLWLRQVSAFNNVPIVESAEVRYVGITFSNDSNDIYYVVKPRNNTIGTLYRVPVLGGNSTKVISDVDSPVSFSPDGQKLTFVRGSFNGEYALMTANADGTGEKKLAVRMAPDLYDFGGPAWSPDGQTILCAAGHHAGGAFYEDVVAVRTDNGAEKPASEQRWHEVHRINWFANGSGFVMSASDKETDLFSQLWHVTYPEGRARRITNDDNEYSGLSMTADGSALVTVRVESTANIWLLSLGGDETLSTVARNESAADAGVAKQITFGIDRYDGVGGLRWTPGGKIIYRSRASGRAQIWSMNRNGSEQKQLTDASHTFNPMHIWVTADGSSVLFDSITGYTNIWRMKMDGGELKRLTNGRGEFFPAVSPDGKWLFYSSNASGKQTVWKMPLETMDSPAQLTDARGDYPVISPDGKWVACNYRDDKGGAQWRIAIVSVEGGEPAKIFDIPSALSIRPIEWLSDSSAITYIDTRGEVSNVWSQPLDSSSSRRLTDFKVDHIFDFAWSRDGRQLALARGSIRTDVVSIKNLR